MKAWAEGGGYKVTVYREVMGGAAYRKIGEYGKESGKRAGILWKKRRVYMVILEEEGEVGGSAASKRGNKEYGRRAPAQESWWGAIENKVWRPTTVGHRRAPKILWGSKIPKPATVRNTTFFVKLYHKEHIFRS